MSSNAVQSHFRHQQHLATARCRVRDGFSDSEDDPAEGAALDEEAQSIRRIGQRERLCHDGLDRAGLKQWNNDAPCGASCQRRLCEQGEALHTRALPDQICDVDGCLAARGVAQCSQTSSDRKRT